VEITVEPHSTVPPYEQVRARIAELAGNAELPAGTRLPTVRQLAGELNLAVNTIARAYRELETAGLVETRGRNGTFVTARAAGVPAEAERLAAAYVAATRRLGLSPDKVIGLVQAALANPTNPGYAGS